MLRYHLTLVLLLAAILASGCSTIRRYNVHYRPVDQRHPPALVHVNLALQGQRALVTYTDGRTFEAYDVRVAPDSTSWYVHGEVPRDDRLRRVATTRIARVERPRFNHGTAPGAVIGIGLAVAAIYAALHELGEVEGPAGFGLVYLLPVAIVGMTGSGILGAKAGQKLGHRTPRLVYEGPVERYLDF